MSDYDPDAISKAMSQLLLPTAEERRLTLDESGWADIIELCAVVSADVELTVDETVILEVVHNQRRRFELSKKKTRIRAVRSSRPTPNPRRYTKEVPPDILFLPTSRSVVGRFRKVGKVFPRHGHNHLRLSPTESLAWRDAHRRQNAQPAVLFVDATRAHRSGVRFWRHKQNGTWLSTPIPLRHVLNLRRNFAVQLSAGGLPVCEGPDGKPRVALIQVTRRSGVTWEVAKGKLEPGEPPEVAAVREVQEEMGVEVHLEVLQSIGVARYGFLAPGGAPRLKTMFMYLLRPATVMEDFCPSTREGIGQVRWFTPDEACAVVTHTSLKPLMEEARRVLSSDEFALTATT